MFRLNNKPILSSTEGLWTNIVRISSSMDQSDSVVYMNLDEAPPNDSIAYFEIFVENRTLNPPVHEIILSRYVRIHDILKVTLPSNPEETICKVIFRESRDILRYERLLQNSNVIHIGGYLATEQLSLPKVYLNHTLDDWPAIADYLEPNDDSIEISSTEFPPSTPEQLFWQGRTKLEALDELLDAHNCLIIESVITPPTYNVTTGDIILPAPPYTRLTWRKRTDPILPAGIDYDAIAFPVNPPATADTVAFRTLDSYANGYDDNYLYYTEDPNDNVLIYGHLPYFTGMDTTDLDAQKTYLEETNRNHEHESFFRTRFLPENRLAEAGFEWSDIVYQETGGDFAIDVIHRPYITRTTNPLNVTVDQEFLSGIVKSQISGNRWALEQLNDQVLNYSYPDDFEVDIVPDPGQDPVEVGDRVYGVRAGLEFKFFAKDKVKPHPPTMMGGRLSEISHDYQDFSFQDGDQYILPIDDVDFWKYNISVSSLEGGSVDDDPSIVLDIDDKGICRPRAKGVNSDQRRYEVNYTLDPTITEAAIITHLENPAFYTGNPPWTDEDRASLAKQLIRESSDALFYVDFPVSTFWCGPRCQPKAEHNHAYITDIQSPFGLTVESPRLIERPYYAYVSAASIDRNVEAGEVTFSNFSAEGGPLLEDGPNPRPFFGDPGINPNDYGPMKSPFIYYMMRAWLKEATTGCILRINHTITPLNFVTTLP